MAFTFLALLSPSLLILVLVLPAHAKLFNPWRNAHATYYGGPDGSGTTGGACGYEESYGPYTTALNTVLFKDAQSCGACFEVKCSGRRNKWCKRGNPSIVVTATNFCPPGGWCSPPRVHFDLSQPAFVKIAEQQAGITPIKYRRVPCTRQGGIRFTITGNPNFNLVTVSNVGGGGDVKTLEVKAGNGAKWTKLHRNWGVKWETNAQLVGKPLTFRVTTSDGRTIVSQNAASKSWQFGQTLQGKNF